MDPMVSLTLHTKLQKHTSSVTLCMPLKVKKIFVQAVSQGRIAHHNIHKTAKEAYYLLSLTASGKDKEEREMGNSLILDTRGNTQR